MLIRNLANTKRTTKLSDIKSMFCQQPILRYVVSGDVSFNDYYFDTILSRFDLDSAKEYNSDIHGYQPYKFMCSKGYKICFPDFRASKCMRWYKIHFRTASIQTIANGITGVPISPNR